MQPQLGRNTATCEFVGGTLKTVKYPSTCGTRHCPKRGKRRIDVAPAFYHIVCSLYNRADQSLQKGLSGSARV